ncbi:MAG: glucose 1-dehydrogenase [Candidatus Caenarcaniphilales bacterium]|nr:glucose 1-dehydrogenase [Candidatus Caenarcaniphilales bacterium]
MKDKSIIITGGNSGIGLATAELFASNGVNVAIIGRRSEQNSIALEKLKKHKVKVISFAGSVTDESFIQRSMKEAFEEFGGLHFAFNNAGVEQVPTPLEKQTVEDYRQVIDVNVMGVWMSMREEIPLIKKSGGGSIINTSSVAGHIGMSHVPLYIAAKHAVLGLTKSIALEYAKEGIRINAVSPGAVETELYSRFTGNKEEMKEMIKSMHPMGRTGKVEEVASAVLYLCKDATWTTGQSLIMDGGFTSA